jgi:hypothetical protein
MALDVTLAYLKEQVRSRADQQNSQFITDAELTDFINGSASSLYDLLVQAAEDYFVTSQTITIVQGTNEYSLPTNFYKVLGVDYFVNNKPVPMSRFNFRDRHLYNYLDARPEIVRYGVWGQQLVFKPVAPQIASVVIWYVPTITKLVNDADVLDGVNGWEEYVILDAAIKAMVKEESDPSALIAQLQMVKDRIATMSKDRDQGEPQKTTDIIGSRYDQYRFFDYGY